ncbi:MAG: hypothetical protein NT031_01265 [Planctomycetota bacterium]|nr:hypothetical protein [Planctomycetota bacterium]
MHKTAIALTILTAALSAGAQGLDNEFPYTGTIASTGAIVHTTAMATGTNSVMRLTAGAEVTVYGRSEGWLKIKPPEGSFSIVPRYAVTKDADGKNGSVAEDRTPAFAGSTILPPPWPFQVRLTKGTRVQILGEVVDEGRPFVKIAPPEGVYLYVPARSVQKAGSPATPGAGKTQGPTDLAGTTDHTKPPTDAGATPPPPPVDPQKAAAIAAVNAAEASLKTELAKPSGQQDLDGLLQRYSALKNEHGARMGDRIDAGLRAIAIASKRKQALAEIDSHFRTVTAIQAEPVPQWRSVAKASFAACGTLAASEVYGSTDAAYRRFAIHDPADPTRILAYVQDPAGQIDFTRYIGKNVGIVGTVRTQAGSAESVIDVREVVDLGAGAIPSLTNPATPGVKVGPGDTLAPPAIDQPADTNRMAPGDIIIDPGSSEVIKPEARVAPPVPAAPPAIPPATPPAPTAPADDRPAPDARPGSTEPPAGFKLFKPDEGLGSPVNSDEYK